MELAGLEENVPDCCVPTESSFDARGVKYQGEGVEQPKNDSR